MTENLDGLKNKKILVVDDTPANIDILLQILEPQGLKIFVASSGEVALKLVSQVSLDLILLDVMMPGIDGFETCRRLKLQENAANVPIIFITAKNETKDIVKGFSLGGVDYITKPFRNEEVCARVFTHLKLRDLVQELERKNGKLIELNDLKTKFLGMASHDMRNPLASIHGFSKLLLNDGDSLPEETRREFLQSIQQVTNKLLELLNDLLDVSMIESGQLDLKLNSGSLERLIQERVGVIRIFSEKKNMKIHLDLETIPDAVVDANRIGQVLDNLLSNAVKFSPPGKNIFVSLREEGTNAVVRVRDEGPGISAEDQTKLFHHFQKLNAKPTGGESSSGLGLAIAKRMVEAHNGVLKVESELDRGSTFGFEIPLRPVETN